ncbi:LLM class flavin-dependent oxidoreductase [Phreatobacter stygius]|uniref:LLM class flavin-dependent oxidoreductase n=1 Tax=Phreatobacter stygius TaxID=1940610 RepID=A0A4D7BEB8_9HYPH|nr:LLM class flavin-dependent oxidoreductase [Phreatobacter stygius]QCI68298.1 LLM class flavin-dependent oxidoreductase [Phreatobacter stygius]
MRIDLAGWTREATLGDHRAFLALFERADRLGFDGVWFAEFHFRAGLPYPSTLLLAAAIFARTGRLRVGTSILVLPLHHPLMLAEQIAQLDFQSGGRLDVGIGRGTDPATFAALGIEQTSARDRFEQGFAILRQALTHEQASAGTGPWHFSDVPVGPRVVQRPHPPLYVAGSTPETLGFAVAHDLPLLLSLEPPEGRQLGIYRDLLARSGRPSALARSSLSRYVCIGATQAAAEARIDDLLPRIYQRRLGFAAARGVPADQVPPLDRDQVLRDQVIHGDPDACHAEIVRLKATTGIGELRCVFNGNGVLDNETALAGMELFAAEVLPALRRERPTAQAAPEVSFTD